jgi:hypothetical protein
MSQRGSGTGEWKRLRALADEQDWLDEEPSSVRKDEG